MRRYLLLIAVILSGPFAVTLCAAADTGKRFYVDAVYLFNSTSDANTADVDFDGDNGQAGYLGYRFIPSLSVEIGGAYFQPIDGVLSTPAQVQTTEHEVSGYTLGIRTQTSFANLFDIWAGVGLYSWESTFNYEIRYPPYPGTERRGSDTNSGEDVYYRVGVTLPFTDSVQVTVESAYFELNDFFSSADGGDNVDLEQRYIGLGLEYSF